MGRSSSRSSSTAKARSPMDAPQPRVHRASRSDSFHPGSTQGDDSSSSEPTSLDRLYNPAPQSNGSIPQSALLSPSPADPFASEKDNPSSTSQPMTSNIRLHHGTEARSKTLDELRKRMEETLAFQHSQHSQPKSSSHSDNGVRHHNQADGDSTSGSARTRTVRSNPTSPAAVGTIRATGYGDSAGSTNTVKEIVVPSVDDEPTLQTPSYPFPVMFSPSAFSKSDDSVSRPDISPAKSTTTRVNKAPGTIDITSAGSNHSTKPYYTFIPPGVPTGGIVEDPTYPSPNLYDVILKLNADAGLDAWWSNVVEVLQTHFGAERASLALPGDSTDLENVPWGQKATFNPARVTEKDEDTALGDDSRKPNDGDGVRQESTPERKMEEAAAKSGKHSSSTKRPSLLARHSFAGFGKDKRAAGLRGFDRFPPSSREETIHEHEDLSNSASRQGSNASYNSPLAIFPTLRALETETDPLIKRTGVVKLFGRTKPAVLTREYAYEAMSSATQASPILPSDDKDQITPASEPSRSAIASGKPPDAPVSKEASQGNVSSIRNPRLAMSKPTTSNLRKPKSTSTKDSQPPSHNPIQLYEEYEQAPPSPWSQSPAPSPAPRTHPEHNPFFTSHTVDEAAFASDPPPYDYSQATPLAAIGVDRSKSVVHIPLLHATSSKQATSETLRFPIAVLSFLSPVVPYPANLRYSLMYLIPHLTTSFSLAQQYSQLERQLAPGFDRVRFGNLLGLGGTFSDASSELELVAELSGHVTYSVTDDGSVSARATISSPDDASNPSRFSPSLSLTGTPAVETGTYMSLSEPSATPGLVVRQANEHPDSYFNLQGVRSPGNTSGHQAKGRAVKPRQNFMLSMPPSPGAMNDKMRPSRDDGTTQKESGRSESQSSFKSPATATPGRNSSRHPSASSVVAHFQREVTRPFSDTITQLMLNSVPLHLFLARAQTGEVIWTNSKFDAFRRGQPQEPRIRDPWQNIHPSELDSVFKQWQRALQTGSQFTERVRVKRFNDESAYRWFIFRANPLLSGTGEVLYWIGSFLDIHEQHIAELKAAHEREMFATDAKYRALANSIPQIVFEANERLGLISANEQWHLYTGQTIEDAMNFGFMQHMHRDDLEKCGISAPDSGNWKGDRQDSAVASPQSSVPTSSQHLSAATIFSRGVTGALEDLVERGVVAAQKDENGRLFYSSEIRLRSKGGDYRWHLVRLVKVETSNFGTGEASWYGTCTDINDRKLLERELNRAMQKLNKEMESKTKFFSNMSHEIRTPLNGILGTIPFILDTQLDIDQRRMLDTIQNSSTNLRELVDNILDVSRVEAGKMTLVNSWFHVRSVVEDVIDTVSSRALDKGLELNYLMDVDVPSMVLGDKFRIRQILLNLMGNAVKFTSEGEVYTRCSINRDASVPVNAGEILLNFDVIDTGKGFSPAEADRLMQRFSQIGGTASQQHSGSGLGLFLSKQLVEMHGGRLTPSGREGQGAKFSFYVKVDVHSSSVETDPSLTRHSSEGSETPTTGLQSSRYRLPLLSKNSSDSRVLSIYDLSPAAEPSPTVASTSSSDPPSQSGSNYRLGQSPLSSGLHTPDNFPLQVTSKRESYRKDSSSFADGFARDQSHSSVAVDGDSIQPTPAIEKAPTTNFSPPLIYSVLILCPFDHAREAIKQHVEQVTPHEVPATVTSLADVDDWKDLMQSGNYPTMSHLVLNLPSADDTLEVLQLVHESKAKVTPTVVIISDLYQKREINSKIEDLISAGVLVETVPKPVKPSLFSRIFDPDSRRDLSKDRNQDMAREVNNNFKTMSRMVKEVVGNKGYRILLVEDDETNRMVMLKYLDKIKVLSETASNGQECLDMVFSKDPGYYSLIICDIQMPIKNGYDTCREIREWEAKNRFPRVPIMALSANAMTDQIDDAARVGFNDYVTKPIKHNELGKMIMHLLGSKPQPNYFDKQNN